MRRFSNNYGPHDDEGGSQRTWVAAGAAGAEKIYDLEMQATKLASYTQGGTSLGGTLGTFFARTLPSSEPASNVEMDLVKSHLQHHGRFTRNIDCLTHLV